MRVTSITLFDNSAGGGVKMNLSADLAKGEAIEDVMSKLRSLLIEAAPGVIEAAPGKDKAPPLPTGDEAGEADPPKPRRRRAAAKEEEAPKEEKPRRRRAAAKEEEAPKEEKPTRRRRKTKEEEPAGPTAEDVAKAASDAAQALGPKLAGDIIGDYSDTGKIADIPADKRQAFLDDVDNEMSED